MKNIKFLILIMTFAFVATSCDKYDDYDADRVPVVGFTAKVKNINGIKPGTEKSTTIDVFASDISSEDRVFEITDVEIDNPDEFPPTARENYSYDTTVTIPAGERIGTIEVIGKNTTDITSKREYFRLKVKNVSGVAAGGEVNVGLRG